jgi:hypothetical protein
MPRRPTLATIAAANLRASEPDLRTTQRIFVASQAVVTIWQLATAATALGEWPTKGQYAAHWRIDERTAEREWARFRRAFPTESSPERLARWLQTEALQRTDDSSAALSVLAPPDLLPA